MAAMRSMGAGSQSSQEAQSALTAAARGPGGTVSTGRSGSEGKASGGPTSAETNMSRVVARPGALRTVIGVSVTSAMANASSARG